jgi:archaemetzincin
MSTRIHFLHIGSPDPGIVDAIVDAVFDLGSAISEWDADLVRSHHDLDPAPFHDSRRNQYSSRMILSTLLDLVPEPDRVLGITDVDLFQPILTFVFGEAQLGGRAAVVSTARLEQRWYGLPQSDSLFYERSVKEALHELGHTWGLIHCSDFHCVMTASRVVEEIDTKQAGFCASCRAQLRVAGTQTVPIIPS